MHKILLLTIGLLILVGLVLPELISSQQTEFVVAGAGIIIVLVYLAIAWIAGRVRKFFRESP